MNEEIGENSHVDSFFASAGSGTSWHRMTYWLACQNGFCLSEPESMLERSHEHWWSINVHSSCGVHMHAEDSDVEMRAYQDSDNPPVSSSGVHLHWQRPSQHCISKRRQNSKFHEFNGIIHTVSCTQAPTEIRVG